MKILCLILALLPLLASAEVYKWTDENGNVHFGDRPKNLNKAEVVEIREQKTGSMVSEKVKKDYQYSARNAESENLEKARESYQKVRAGFYETENPSDSCRYAVDLQDKARDPYGYGPKRKIYLCPKE